MTEKRRKDRESEFEDRFIKNILRAIRCELVVLDELYYAGIGRDLLNVKEGEYLTVRFALTEDFYTVFSANAVHFGKLSPPVAKQIIKVYALVKGQVEQLRINNTMLDFMDGLDEFRRVRGPTETKVRDQLTAHARRLKDSQAILKREYENLCKLLDGERIN